VEDRSRWKIGVDRWKIGVDRRKIGVDRWKIGGSVLFFIGDSVSEIVRMIAVVSMHQLG
jgi:hypothetical protein